MGKYRQLLCKYCKIAINVFHEVILMNFRYISPKSNQLLRPILHLAITFNKELIYLNVF